MKKYITIILISALLLTFLVSCEKEPTSAYEIAVANGFTGSVEEWLDSLKSPSNYDLAVENGFEGSLEQWLESLKVEGKSAYELAVEQGFEGTLDEWLETLKSPSPYDLAVQQGFQGTLDEWLDSLTPDTVAVNLGNYFDNNFDKQGYVNPYTGEEGSSASLKYTTSYYSFEPGNLFYRASKAAGTIVFLFYDTDKNYVGYHAFSGETDSICGFGFGGYFRCYVDLDYDGQVYLSNNVPADEVDYSYSLTEVVPEALEKTKLTVVNFGDSIFGNTQRSGSVSGYLQRISGHRVYNFGFGGTTMATRADSEDWDKFAFHSIVDSVCSGDFSAQQNVLGGDTYFPSYFHTTIDIMDTIDWNDVDVITIAYGTNDYREDGKLRGDDFDVDYYTGAFQYAVKQLQETYPHIRIIAVTPILRLFDEGTSDIYDPCGNGTLLDFKNALTETAVSMRIPVVNAYDELALSPYNRDLYYQIDDGTHLNERGRAMFASLINAKINEVCADLTVTSPDKTYGE